ncbi:glycosyltransferase family 2 protein [Lacisediminihabitans profunda]|uniref:Glycosyltransferase family 2 protein n=1 Tax=Lacisediminihabitans profunda TaxID=2594790 RepID=A0A5C8ULS8_9MICO|nr:glycosyltransferase family 2 protein [Lacisediminihabitans profunda]TXN28230.1 glycosyltransferase family 2 protein [Lacisediminihabitans profunda]
MNTLVSVALCTRNGAEFVEAQLRSILDQDRPPDEIIVSDDASTDETLAIVDRVLGTQPPGRAIRFVILRNAVALGVTANFESAIMSCGGEIIALSDQDDVWHPGRLERVLSEFEARPDVEFLFSDARLVDTEGRDLGLSLFDALEFAPSERERVHSGDAFGLLLKRNLATGATAAFRRALLTTAMPIPEPWLHDEWLAIVASAVGRIDAIEEQLIDYRQHGANEIGVQRATLVRKVRRVLQPRGSRNEMLARRFGGLAQRLESLGPLVRPGDLQRAQVKAAMEADRAGLPTSRFARLRPVLANYRKGWYAEYSSQGRLDLIRDLLQPH